MVGISTDDHETQCEFASSVNAPYPMVADHDGAISREYDVFWPFIRLVRRVTFIIDPEGIIRGVLSHEFAIGKHVDDSVETLRRWVKKRANAATASHRQS